MENIDMSLPSPLITQSAKTSYLSSYSQRSANAQDIHNLVLIPAFQGSAGAMPFQYRVLSNGGVAFKPNIALPQANSALPKFLPPINQFPNVNSRSEKEKKKESGKCVKNKGVREVKETNSGENQHIYGNSSIEKEMMENEDENEKESGSSESDLCIIESCNQPKGLFKKSDTAPSQTTHNPHTFQMKKENSQRNEDEMNQINYIYENMDLLDSQNQLAAFEDEDYHIHSSDFNTKQYFNTNSQNQIPRNEDEICNLGETFEINYTNSDLDNVYNRNQE
jgi:hypothetical protein